MNGQRDGVAINVPPFIKIDDVLHITPTFVQLIVSMEVLPAEGATDVPGTLARGKIQLRVSLASGASVTMNEKQADAFLTLIGIRTSLVQPASGLM